MLAPFIFLSVCEDGDSCVRARMSQTSIWKRCTPYNREEKHSFSLFITQMKTEWKVAQVSGVARSLSTQVKNLFLPSNKWLLMKRKVALRSLRSLFGWGHLFLMFLARRKFCKSSKSEFYIFSKVFTIWMIRWYNQFFFKPFSNEEIAPHSIAEFCDL